MQRKTPPTDYPGCCVFVKVIEEEVVTGVAVCLPHIYKGKKISSCNSFFFFLNVINKYLSVIFRWNPQVLISPLKSSSVVGPTLSVVPQGPDRKCSSSDTPLCHVIWSHGNVHLLSSHHRRLFPVVSVHCICHRIETDTELSGVWVVVIDSNNVQSKRTVLYIDF